MTAIVDNGTGEVVEVTLKDKMWITTDGRCFFSEQLNFNVPEGTIPTNVRRFQTALAIYKIMVDWCIERDEERDAFIPHNEKLIQRAISYADNFLKELSK